MNGRILLLSINYPPDLIGAARYTGELAAWLVQRGYMVRTVTAPPYYPAWRVSPGYRSWLYHHERIAGAEVTRCPLWVRPNLGGGGRILHLASFAAAAAPVLLWQALAWRPHLVLAVCPTLLAVPAALAAARLAGARAWLHVQDLEVDAAFALGLVGGSWSRRLALCVERALMSACDMVSTIAPAMMARLKDKGVTADRLHFMPNWIDGEAVGPLPGPSPMRAELGCAADDVLVLYAGNMGRKQGLDTIIEAARALSGVPGLRFLLVGDGPERPALEQAARGLDTVRFAPLVPADRLNELMNAADIHLLPQRPDAEGLVMPSKLSAMMASGRPVVAAAVAGSDVAEAVAGGGIVVPPGSGTALAEGVRRLAAAPALRRECGDAARRRALALWNRDEVLAAFERRLRGLLEPGSPVAVKAGEERPS